MADEPQREIEKTLGDYARQRRDEAGESKPLHPATRRMLQGEVARTWSRGEGKTGFLGRLMAGHGARVGVGLGALVLLAAALLFFLPDRKEHGQVSALALNGYKASDADAIASRKKSESPRVLADDLPRRDLNSDVTKQLETDKEKLPMGMDFAANRTITASAAPATDSFQKDSLSLATRPQSKLENSSSVTLDESLPMRAPAMPTATVNNLTLQNRGTAGEFSDGNKPIISGGSIEMPQASTATPAPAPVVVATPPPIVAPPSGTTLAMETRSRRLGGAASGGGGGGGGFGGAAPVSSDANGATAQTFSRLVQPAPGQAVDKLQTVQVLASFRVEQTGDQLKFIDSDGSVYVGTKIGAVEKGLLAKAKTPPAQAAETMKTDSADFKNAAIVAGSGAIASPTAPVTDPGYAFHVTGTNVTLNQLVVFDGRFVPTAAPVNAPASAATPSFAAGFRQPVADRSTLKLSKSSVTGHLIIGTNQIDISAEAAKP